MTPEILLLDPNWPRSYSTFCYIDDSVLSRKFIFPFYRSEDCHIVDLQPFKNQIQMSGKEDDNINTSGTGYLDEERGLSSLVEGSWDLNGSINPIRWILPKYADTYEVEKFRNNAMIIFNHESFLGGNLWPRYGTMEDQKVLQETFEKLNFIVEPHVNLTKEKVMDKLKNFAARNFTHCGCVCVAVMTHGSHYGRLRAHDRAYYEQELLEYFDGSQNPTLVGKPIIFLIQACRGEKLATAVNTETQLMDYSNDVYYYELPITANTFIFHSSFFGQASVRPLNGSWFIQTLCKKINLLADTEDFQTICMAVQKEIALDKSVVDYQSQRGKQMPVTTSTLIRRLFLRPSGVLDEYYQYMIKTLRSGQGTYVYMGKPYWGGEETSPEVKSFVGRFFRHWLARPAEYCLMPAVLDTPFLNEMPHGMLPGRMVRFCGQVPIDCERFSINFQCGPNMNILTPTTALAFHMDFRLNYGRVEVALNSFGQRGWGREEFREMPLRQGKAFEVLVLCTLNSFKVWVDGDFYCEFVHRVPWTDIKYILVKGAVTLALVAFEKLQ